MNTDPGIGDLLRQLRDDTSQLVRDEVALAKAEAKEIAGRSLRQLAGLAAGGVVVVIGLAVAVTGVAQWLAVLLAGQGMDAPAALLTGFLLIGLLTAAIGAGLIVKAKTAFTRSSLEPERTARSLREDKQWVKEKLS